MVTDIEINSQDTNQILIACGNLNSPGGGVYKTNNGGNTWFQVSGIPNPIVGKIQICHAPSNPNIIYAIAFIAICSIGSIIINKKSWHSN